MKKFLKITALLLALLLMAAVAVSADTVPAPTKYDPLTEGIVSSYYSIDYERGYIIGIAPGTTAEKLKNACIPGTEIKASDDTIVTGTTITATVTVVIEPETQPTEAPTETIPPTEAPTETTPPTEAPTESTPPTEAPTESTHPTEAPTETTPPTEAPTETEPPTEPSTDTTPPEESSTETTPPEETSTETTPPEESSTETTPPEETTTETTPPEETTTETSDEPQVAAYSRMRSVTTETKTFTLTAIVTGDLNGDGAVTITDMLKVKSAVLGNSLSELAAVAGDVNYDGKVTITDFLQLKAYLLKLGTISAGKAAGMEPKDSLLLMTPGETKAWSADGAVSYTADDVAIAAVDDSGTVTAGSAEGSTFVYALDADGEVLSRAIVTVLKEKLSVSIGAATHKLIRGETLSLTASFNHPVSPAVTWTSSDPKVVSVDADGKITTPGNGTAVVTATLENGSKAETTITVVPPITSIKIERALYKVKPGASRVIPVALEPADTGEELIWSSSDISVAKVSADGTVTGIRNGTATITVKGKYSGLKASCKIKVCNVKQVAITFDDGPSNYTADLLAFLEQNDIRATFFLVGNRVNRYSETVKRIGAGGHELGYHSYNHVSQPSLSSKQVTSEYKVSNSEVKKLTGRAYTVWRTPGGGYNERVLNCVPLPHIMWSVDTLDWQTMRTDAVYKAVKGAKDGSIILLHDLYKTSVNGAIKAMKEMNAGDYEFLTVTELLSRKGTPPKPSTNYFSG